MGILLKKRKEVVSLTWIARISIVGFMAAFSASLIDTIWAVYMDNFFNSTVIVGLVSALLTLISFLSYFVFIPLIEKSNKSNLYTYSLLLFALSYILFAFISSLSFFLILATFVTVLYTIRITSFGIIVKDKSSKKQLSRNEGLMYTFANLSFLLGPLLAGFILSNHGISFVFLASALILLIGVFIFKISKIRDAHIKKKPDKKLTKNFIDFFRNKDRVIAYLLGGGVNLWWVLIYLFIPLYIIRNGLETVWVGYFLFAVAIPVVSLTYLFSKIAGRVGFKKIFIIGFSIPAIMALICFFISNIYVILILLVIGGVGLAMTEATTEAYFFDISKKEVTRFYGPYNTTIEINQFIGKLLTSMILIFLPFKFVFLLFSFFMLIMVWLSTKTKKIIERKL